MHKSLPTGDGHGPSRRTVDIIVAIVILCFGAAVVWDSVRLGRGWAIEGPQAGFFPFYIGSVICAASILNLVRAVMTRGHSHEFVSGSQFKQVLWVLIPVMVFVALIGWLGIYVSAAIFIGMFMRVVGRFSWPTVAIVAIGIPVLAFLTFEIWFLTPLPKGPLETALGY